MSHKPRVYQAVNPIAVVISEGTVQPGQNHRSSGDFTTETSSPPARLQWWITDNPNSAQIVFDVMDDYALWPDKVIFTGLTNGAITDYFSSNKLYIANPQNTGGTTFGVQVWPYPS